MAATATRKDWDENSIYNQYIKEVNKYPLLERAEEKTLLELASRGNRRAMDKLVVSNLKFVINIAFMYKNQGIAVNELINEGNLGLMEAARRFDHNQPIKFISYAVWWIRQSITRAIAEKARVVRISAEKELVLRRLNKKSSRLVQTIGGHYTLDHEEIAASTDYDEKQVANILKMGQRHASLDAPVGEEGESNLLELTPSDGVRADEYCEAKSMKDYITASMNQLDSQQQEVIKYYYGIGSSFTMNLQEIGKMIGLSKERVRQVKEKALAQLRGLGVGRELRPAA
tara:strand:+ start:2763 stop:3620 length:858 start_codon:yes stop_codon:yes gene_type:complete